MSCADTFYINERKKTASTELAYLLKNCIEKVGRPWKELIFLCIGSDRITGDSLGPLIGHELSKYSFEFVHIYGTLARPVHALNLAERLEQIRLRHPESLVVAIDASLGTRHHLGFITVSNAPICPGAGVHKQLPPVGDISITGIVNLSGSFEQLLLQTTRLSTIIRMAEVIAQGILLTFPPLSRVSGQNSALSAFSSEAISAITR